MKDLSEIVRANLEAARKSDPDACLSDWPRGEAQLTSATTSGEPENAGGATESNRQLTLFESGKEEAKD